MARLASVIAALCALGAVSLGDIPGASAAAPDVTYFCGRSNALGAKAAQAFTRYESARHGTNAATQRQRFAEAEQRRGDFVGFVNNYEAEHSEQSSDFDLRCDNETRSLFPIVQAKYYVYSIAVGQTPMTDHELQLAWSSVQILRDAMAKLGRGEDGTADHLDGILRGYFAEEHLAIPK